MSSPPTARHREFPTLDEACRALAEETAELIRTRASEGRHAVLGLPTGGTPRAYYRELAKLHREDALSFGNVVTFNLDEYLGLGRTHAKSYWHYMHEVLFDQVDIPPHCTHLPDGDVAESALPKECHDYEAAIRHNGGIDLTILGIGRTGHIGFNEPGSRRDSRTRVVELSEDTREDAAHKFGGVQGVPYRAISMGVATILESRRIVLLAGGESKAGIVAAALRGPVTAEVPASYLQEHPEATFYLDSAAAAQVQSASNSALPPDHPAC